MLHGSSVYEILRTVRLNVLFLRRKTILCLSQKNFRDARPCCSCMIMLKSQLTRPESLMTYQFSRVLYFAFYIQFRPGQECVSCNRILVLGSIRFLVPSICFRLWNRRGEGRGARKHRGRGVLKISHKQVIGGVHKINLRTESLCCKNFLFLKICKIPNNINAKYNIYYF